MNLLMFRLTQCVAERDVSSALTASESSGVSCGVIKCKNSTGIAFVTHITS